MPRRIVAALAALIVLGFVAHFATLARHNNKPAPGIDGLSWMSGVWSGEHDGGTIEEHWMLPKGKAMVGMARLVVGERMAFWECLRIVERPDGTVVYLAQPAGRCPPTEFTLTSVDVGAAVFENPKHDNPKIIRYTLSDEGKTLTAVTEGDEKGQRVVHETVMRTVPTQ